MLDLMPFNALRPYLGPQSSGAAAVQDTDCAFRVLFDGAAGTATIDVDSGVADTIRLIDPTNGTTDIDLTNAAYNTIGEVADKINSVAGWHCTIVAAERESAVISGATTYLLSAAAQTARTAAGADIFWDTSAINKRYYCFGWEDCVNGVDGRTLRFGSRTSKGTIPFGPEADPVYRDGGATTTARTQPFQFDKRAARLRGGSLLATQATSISGRIRRCTQLADGDIRVVPMTTATVTNLLTHLGEEGITSGPQERFVITIIGGGALTLEAVSLQGELGEYA